MRFLRHRGIYRPMRGSATQPGPERRLPHSDSRPSSTAQREVCAIPIVPMSSDRLFLDGLLASMARLRFTGTINLTWLFQSPAPNRTFLLCLDRSLKVVWRSNNSRAILCKLRLTYVDHSRDQFGQRAPVPVTEKARVLPERPLCCTTCAMLTQ